MGTRGENAKGLSDREKRVIMLIDTLSQPSHSNILTKDLICNLQINASTFYLYDV